MSIIKKFNLFKINEMTEFNLQRFSSDSVQASSHVDDRQLSVNAFDKHEDSIRQAMSRISDVMYSLKGTNNFKSLRSKIALENQDITNLKILRIIKSQNYTYDVYVAFIIEEEEYWGIIENIMSPNAILKSEVFKDYDLYQPKEWIIKISGLIIKTIKTWLKPEPGMYRLLNESLLCNSVETGKQIKMEVGIEIELVRSFDDKIIIRYENALYNVTNDNYIYFNWWFEKIE